MAAAVVAGGFLMAGEWEARVKILLLFRQMMVYPEEPDPLLE